MSGNNHLTENFTISTFCLTYLHVINFKLNYAE